MSEKRPPASAGGNDGGKSKRHKSKYYAVRLPQYDSCLRTISSLQPEPAHFFNLCSEYLRYTYDAHETPMWYYIHSVAPSDLVTYQVAYLPGRKICVCKLILPNIHHNLYSQIPSLMIFIISLSFQTKRTGGGGIPAGVEGFLLTCMGGKEFASAREVMNVLQEVCHNSCMPTLCWKSCFS